MQTINVALRGFDDPSKRRMSTLFTVNFRGQCRVVDAARAEVTIVDLDGCSAAERAGFLAGAGIDSARTVFVADDEVQAPSLRVLKKPVRIEVLREAILQAFAGQPVAAAGSTAATTTADAPVAAPAVAPATPGRATRDKPAVFRPADYFVGWLQEQLQQTGSGETLWLSTWHGKVLVFQPGKNLLHTDLTRHQLRNLAATPVPKSLRDASTIERRPYAPLRTELGGLSAMSVEAFLWELAYLTSRGRLPEGWSPDERYYLGKWPNFTRLPRMPNGMRIAAIWAGAPQKLDGIAGKLGIPREEVYAFCYAGQVLGLTDLYVGRPDEQLPKARGEQKSPARNMLSALLRHVTAPIRGRTAEQLTLEPAE